MAKIKVTPHSRIAIHISGRIKRKREIPEALIATNSKLSPRLPNVMMEEIRIAMGMASIRREVLAYHKNWAMVKKSRPLPTRSSMYFHKICIIKTKKAIKNVMMNGPIKDLMMSLSSFFIISLTPTPSPGENRSYITKEFEIFYYPQQKNINFSLTWSNKNNAFASPQFPLQRRSGVILPSNKNYSFN